MQANSRKWFRRARNRLQINAEYVNSLNVFPVPDGDTGTNMNLSMTSGAKAVVDSTSEKVGDLATMLSGKDY